MCSSDLNPIKEVVWFWCWSENKEAVVHSTGQPTCWSRSRPWYREQPSTGGPKLERRCNCRRADPPSKATEWGRPRQLPGGALTSQASRLLSWRLSCFEFGGFIFFFFFFFLFCCGFGSRGLKDDMDVGAERERKGFGLNGFEREVFGSQENERKWKQCLEFCFFVFFGKG